LCLDIESRITSKRIIDKLYLSQDRLEEEPRTYRVAARKVYMAVAKQRRSSGKVRRRGIKQQLQYLRRNRPGRIEQLLQYWGRKDHCCLYTLLRGDPPGKKMVGSNQLAFL
jgi:hypothetical protein